MGNIKQANLKNKAYHFFNGMDKIDGYHKVDGYIEETNGHKYLVFASTKLWDRIKNLIKIINGGEAGKYGKDFMKIKFNSNENFPLNKILKLHNLTVVVRSVFQEDNKYIIHKFFQINVCISYENATI